MQVVALIHEEKGAFGVSFPDFPGATTVAGDADTALAKAAEMLAFHVEGLAEDGPLPEPRTLSDLRLDPEFRKAARNAMIALVPYAPPARVQRINITMDEGLLERVDRAAELSGETRSGFLAEGAKLRLARRAASYPSGFAEVSADGSNWGKRPRRLTIPKRKSSAKKA